ncbi:MAG: DUF1559 domain-containing protein [Planctomycetaceae bacterium]|nr:DUF1559 domain-containing protein [Planctomycetaceae bacterium]
MNGSLGFFGTIFPYIEQQALYDLIANNPTDSNDNVGFAVPLDNTWWDGLTEEQRNSFGSLPFLKCPARRSGKQLISNFDGFDPSNIFAALPPEYLTMFQGRYLKGPRGDYAIVVFDLVSPPPPMSFSRMDVATGNGVLAASSVSTYNSYLKEIRSPFRTAIHTLTTGSTNTLSWEPRDKFDSISDGLTNQLFLGEKYIPSSKIGVWAFNQGYDGSVLASTSTVSNTFARHLFRYSATASPTYLARNTDELSSLSPTSSLFPQFGSNHAGIVNFLVGDGSVRPIAVTTNRDILEALADTQDGVPVSLP